MKLNDLGIQNRALWEDRGISLPRFSREKVKKETGKDPFWVHFGAGNIFRAFQARVQQELLDAGVVSRGVIVAEGYDEEILSRAYSPFDDLSILVTLKADGTAQKQVIASVTEALSAVDAGSEDFARLREIFRNPSLQMASFTITEKGYVFADQNGAPLPAVKADFENGPKAPMTYLGRLASLLYERFQNGELPLAMVSMDNCSHNGEKLFSAMEAFGKVWEERGKVQKGFLSYLSDPKRVSFPWTMIDKITPRPDPSVCALLQGDGLEEMEPVVTGKNSYTAPFVNAEECEYLVIEDAFPNGRPPLDKGGFLFTSRDTVNACERMKVCTCLNPLHTALAVFGCLMGYTLISEEMKDPLLKKLCERIGKVEGLPVVTDPKVLSPQKFLSEVVSVRIPNPFLPDTPQRIATDTSQKLSVRYGETVKAYLASEELSVDSLIGIPLVFAGWLRYLLGIDDSGESFSVSADPRLSALREALSGVSFGASLETLKEKASPILKDASIFGVDLWEVGLADRVLTLFEQMLKGPGAVRETLAEHLN